MLRSHTVLRRLASEGYCSSFDLCLRARMGLQELPQDVLRKVFALVLSAHDGDDLEDNRSAWALAQCSRYLLHQFCALFMTSISFEGEHPLSHSLALCRIAGHRGLTTISTGLSKNLLTERMEWSGAAACPLETISVHCKNIRHLDFGLWSPNGGVAFRRILHICSKLESLVLRDPPNDIVQILRSSLFGSCLPRLSYLCLAFETSTCVPIEISGGRDLFISPSQTAAGVAVIGVSEDAVRRPKPLTRQSLVAGSTETSRSESLSRKARSSRISLESARQLCGTLSRATRSPRRTTARTSSGPEECHSLFGCESDKALSAFEATY